jgi:hypothetical protein
LPVAFLGLRLPNDQAAVQGQAAQVDVEALAALVAPGGTDLSPVGIVAFTFDYVNRVRFLALLVRFIGLSPVCYSSCANRGRTGVQKDQRS